MGAESVRGVAKHPFGLLRLCSDSGEDGSPYLEYAVHDNNGYVVRWSVWVGFLGFVYKFRGNNAPFLRRLAIFGHYLEEGIYEVGGCVR